MAFTTEPVANAQLESRRAAKPAGSIAVVALGGVILLGAVVGAALVARAARRTCPGSTTPAANEPLPPPLVAPVGSARATMAIRAARQLAYWCFKALAAMASWLARVARPTHD